MEMAVNYLAVVVAAVVAMIIGSLWYSPLLFGKRWMQLRGVDPESVKGMPTPVREMTLEFITSLLNAFVVALLLVLLGVHAVGVALMLAFWLWVGFYVPVLLGGVLWERRPLALSLLNAGQRLVTILCVALVIVLLQ